ncbi:CDP-glycerol glycerophosphotransferase family protein [uncultured Methanobrevibacter sp.]|uniref:bifunctional glycosyltransferase/CDP-glycerol:glycerophosphate glycerophosphotransferase n=1 Tax=uncultured Methanobrevibacter sp. TaxID=253161 RepID=UPI0025D576E3|nr:CDP-glycerol glycerophosphotransferase family protein [uncultured Methanobrevibacter sp.]
MAIYNTEDFLEEAIDSVINQTLDFEENIQMILVDDGSVDDSLRICEEYKEKYPDNFVVISQENSGQATARNNGLEYVNARYVNFMDSDDYFSEETFENVYRFFIYHDKETDIVSVPIKFFGRINWNHQLNFKFYDNKVLDLTKEPYNPQYHSNSAFFKRDALKDIRFPTDVLPSEDAILINKILLEKKALGVVKDGCYYYRKRNDETSTLDLTHDQITFFTPRLKKYFLRLINYSLDKYGEIPKFLEFTIAHDLYWLFNQPEAFSQDKKEMEEFYYYLHKIISFLSKETIEKLYIEENIKKYFLYLKNGEKHIEIHDGLVSLMTGEKEIDRINYHKLWLDIAKINGDKLNIVGSYMGLIDNKYLSIEAINKLSDGSVTHTIAERKYYPSRDGITYLSCRWQYAFNFDVNIPINRNLENTIDIRINFHKDGDNTNFSEDNVIPITLEMEFQNWGDLYKFSNYAVVDSNILLFNNNQFKIKKYSLKNRLKHEYHCLKKINEFKLPEYKHIIHLRLIYNLIYPIMKFRTKNKPIYLFVDRKDSGQDNAEALWDYALSQNDNIRKYFVVDKNCDDFKRLSKKGKVMDFGSFKHKLYYLFADKLISSHPEDDTINPYFSKQYGHDLRRMICGLCTLDKIFLQHGVTQNNLSPWLTKFDKNIRYFLTVSDLEEEYLTDVLAYENEIYHTLGFPRFDNLKSTSSKRILLCPTWRFNLIGNSLNHKNMFLSSDYYNDLNNLFKSQELNNIFEKYGYKLIFKPHPRLNDVITESGEKYLDFFEFGEHIEIADDETYNSLLNSCDLMITDYSSIAFDFAYLDKPILYYQPNDDIPHEIGYFKIDEMGFGDVVYELDDLIGKIEENIKDNCKNKSKYTDRINNFFKYHDKNNCKRVYEDIKG